MRLLLVALSLLVAGSAAAAPRVGRGPIPGWVRPIEPHADASSGDADDLLDDIQVRVEDDGRSTRFHRRVSRASSIAAIADLAERELTFDPTQERLVLHHIRIYRDGRARDAIPRDIPVVRREQELEDKILDGTLAALILLEDVRVGDVIDYAFSVVPTPSAPRMRHASSWALGFATPTGRQHLRVSAPLGRPLDVREHGGAPPPIVEERDGRREYVWDLADLPAVPFEDDVPAWITEYPWVELSEYRGWDEIVAWRLPSYRPTPDAPAVRRVADEIRAAHGTTEARVRAAIRFAQDDIRYLGLELGAHAFTPHAPSLVLERRFGDCKDKTLLLISLLAALEVEAHPALVHSDLGRSLADRLPSPYAFDHVIAKVVVDGATFWVDATGSHERGRLEARVPPPYRLALVIQAGVSALEAIPEAKLDQPDLVVEKTYRRASPPDGRRLEVVSTYRGVRADSMRARLASTSLEEVAKDYEDFYLDEGIAVERAAPLEVADDEEENVVRVTERYRLSGPESVSLTVEAHVIRARFANPEDRRRTWPLQIEYPLYVEQTVRVELPPDKTAFVRSGSRSDGVAALTLETSETAGVATLRWVYRTHRDSVPAADVPAHLDVVDGMRDLARVELFLVPAQAAAVEGAAMQRDGHGFARVPWLAVLAIVAGVIGGVAGAGWLRHRVARRRTRHDVGEAPDRPLACTDLAAFDWRRLGCPCGAPGAKPDEPPETFAYDGRDLRAVRVTCPRCSRRRSIYLTAP